jgi:uroporphyrin-III C-methyltransferase/precorrin-2 dehydrogenase/sirohydrochlorin ferrochelatase
MSGDLPKPSDRGWVAKGRVALVGAGPGDAELLTLKALKALKSADVILFDALVSDDVLQFARSSAKRMLVGKRGGKPSCKQDDINELMVKLARQGKHVVRLKAGDPAIFGRAGEEIELLEAQGIEVSVVPGVTSASAMAAMLGVSLTHRDHAQSVRFITGHARSSALPDLDWRGLSDPRTTLMIYMGGKTCRDLVSRLVREGLPLSTPAAAVANVSRGDSDVWTGTLDELGAVPEILTGGRPVLIGIGRVFAARAARNSMSAIVPDAADILAGPEPLGCKH